MAKKAKTIVARRTVDFEQELPGVQLVSLAIGPRGEPIALSLDGEADDRAVAKSGVSFPKLFADKRNRYRIRYRVHGERYEVALPPTRENLSEIQPLPDGRWLAVRGRSEGDRDANAHVFDSNGRLLNSFPAGDGIQDVQADERGGIWISYFDEGVFGKTALGQKGLVGLDDAGELLFDFAAQSNPCVESMADCYALNVASSREVWLRYYTDFPLLRIVDRRIADIWHKLPAQGSSAFAIREKRALFEGGYDHRGKLMLVDLDSRKGEKLIPVDDEGEPLGDFYARGRRSILHLACEDGLYEIDLAELS